MCIRDSYDDKKEAGNALLELCRNRTSPDAAPIGQYRGFAMELFFDTFQKEFKVVLKHELKHTVTLGNDVYGNIQRMDNSLQSLPDRLQSCCQVLENTKNQLENAEREVEKTFAQEDELKIKSTRLAELNSLLDLDKTENAIVDDEKTEPEMRQEISLEVNER